MKFCYECAETHDVQGIKLIASFKEQQFKNK